VEPRGGQERLVRQPRETLRTHLHARAVDAIKRYAIVRLHRSPPGEALLLEVYLWAEEASGSDAFADLTESRLSESLEARPASRRIATRSASWFRAGLCVPYWALSAR